MEANIHDNARTAELTQRTKVPARKARTAWRVPAALILLSIIPLTFGVFRLHELASGAEITPANARFFAAPLPVVLHIVGAAVYALLGAFQFVCEPPLAARDRLAPLGRAAPGPMRTGRWVFRALDDPLLPPPGGRQRSAVCTAAPVRVGYGPVNRSWLRRHPTAGHPSTPRLDDARLCHWARRSHTGADRDDRGTCLRPAE